MHLSYSWLEYYMPEGNISKFKGNHLGFCKENQLYSAFDLVYCYTVQYVIEMY